MIFRLSTKIFIIKLYLKQSRKYIEKRLCLQRAFLMYYISKIQTYNFNAYLSNS